MTSTPGMALSSGEEVVGRTVEMTEAGIAVTFPPGWRLWSPGQPDEVLLVASEVPKRQACQVFPPEEFASTSEAADVLFGDPHPSIEILERAVVDLPAGDAVRVFWKYEVAPDEPRYTFYDYYVGTPTGVMSLSCTGEEPPADRWLDIVASIEPLEVGDSASETFDSRVVVPDPGFALDLPAEWLVKAWPEWQSVVLGGDFVLRAQTAMGGPTDSDCWIENATGSPNSTDVRSIDDWRETLIASAEAQQQRATEPVVTDVVLPSGGAVRADWRRFNGMPATAWAFEDDMRRVVLFCRSQEPPPDRWRAIAQSFEFLPAAE
jgi:hypothetical protein